MNDNNSVFLDSGTVTFYKSSTANTPGAIPTGTPVEYSTENFGELTVGVSRFYSALSAGFRIDRMIKVWRDIGLNASYTATIDGETYFVRQVQHTEDSDGMLTTVVSLERKVRG